jgi:uncharacterized protein YdbL (DUF1318 family)
MTRLATLMTAVLAATSLATGCVPVTVNINFPQEKIDSAAASVEDLVRNPAPPSGNTPSTPAPRGRPSSAIPSLLAVTVRSSAGGFGPATAEAQAVPELKTRTPEVMAAVASRRSRLPQVTEALKQGCVGETREGLLEVRPGSACPPNLGALVAAENADRLMLYRTLVEQNKMPPSDLARVQEAFARTHRERVPAGGWVQNPDGTWLKK